MRKNAYYKRHNRQCAACGSWKKIQLHHVSYDNLGHEPDQDLVPLCFKCHRNAHRAHQSGRFRDLRMATEEIVRLGRARQARRRALGRVGRWLLRPLRFQ
jgi:5-methylcytosine-specific restriction endonuclease McrA